MGVKESGVSELVETLAELACLPDGSAQVQACLLRIVDLVTAVVEPVDSASITVSRSGQWVTLASSDALALDLDAEQYTQADGPCLQALDGEPVAVPETGATDQWPQFRQKARSLGLYAALSVPLFALRGVPLASLNLYARDPAAMRPLIAEVLALYDPPEQARSRGEALPGGAGQLVRGLAAALEVNAEIQHALGMLIGSRRIKADQAYLVLQGIAEGERSSLHAAARTLLERHEA
jgi:hypothetical protein